MELSRLVAHINLNTDEDFEFMQVIGFINDAISAINKETSARFPFIDETDGEEILLQDEYTALPETWIRQIIMPYAAGRIKANDSSQFEYTDWYAQFMSSIQTFIARYEIPEQYRDINAKQRLFEEDWRTNTFSPTRGW